MRKIAKAKLFSLEHDPGLSNRKLTDDLLGDERHTRQITQGWRSQEIQGEIIRKQRKDPLSGILPLSSKTLGKIPLDDAKREAKNYLPEKRLKQILENYLIALGWHPEIQWRSSHGVDIEARRGPQCWIIEVNSPVYPSLTLNSSFVSVLGQILQRMDDPACKYSIALPDILPFTRLWSRLPPIVKQKTGISALFVNSSGLVRES